MGAVGIEEQVQEPQRRKPISPARHARLEETFKRASKKATGPRGFDFAAELLAQCVIGDPSNPTYVRAYIDNLQKKHQNNKQGKGLGLFKDRTARSALKKALSQGEWDAAIRHGLEALRANPWDIPTLTRMATAAKESGDSDSELCYLKAALTKAPKDPMCNRMAAVALDEMGLVNQAIVFWERVAEALPKDKEAKEAISEFQIGARARGARQKRLTAQEQAEVARQQQEELARQQKIQEEEEKARRQRIHEQAAPEPVDTASISEPCQADLDNNPNEKLRMIGMSELAESAFTEGYEYGIEETPETASKWTKENLLALGVMLATWLAVLGFVVVRWWPVIWKQMRGHASWTWIIFGVVLLAVAAVVRALRR